MLLPIGWETHSTPLYGDRPQAIINSQVLENSDLLISVFWTRLGTPTGEAASGTVEEIEEHVKAGKPALLYFSSAPVAPESLDHDQYSALTAFKNDCKTKGLYQGYDSVPDFREKVRRHLALTMNSHEYFARSVTFYEGTIEIPIRKADPPIPDLTKEATQLLVEAVLGGGAVHVLHYLSGTSVTANDKDFVEPRNPRSRAIWEAAVEELVREDLLQAVGTQGTSFRVTKSGYEVADLLKT